MIDIKDISNIIRFSAEIKEGSKRKFTLMKEDYITLKFSVENPVYFKLGDRVDNELGLFEVTDIQKPSFNERTGGYDYELRLDAYYLKWKNKIIKYTPEKSGSEASWNLTAPLDVHLGVFLRNLTALGYKYRATAFTLSIDSTVENSAKLVQYDKTNLIDALTKYAEAWKCEWWITDSIIHFGRCEYGATVNFEHGVNVSSMSRSEGSDSFATRIYAFGSTRNIPADYRPSDESAVVNGIVQKRLMLPAGTISVDAHPDMSQEEAIEDVVVFEDVYPHRVGTLSSVSTHEYTDVIKEDGKPDVVKKWNAYRFKDAGITFSKDYVLKGQELRISFQSGTLNGMEFAVTFNPCDKDCGEKPIPEKNTDGSWNPLAQVWEIVRNEDYGRPIPADVLIPKNGDTYVLYGFDTKFVADTMIPAAEQELLKKAKEYVEKSKIDPSTYECKMAPDYIYNNGTKRTFDIGDRVNLINKAYFESGRQSRIIGYEYPIDIPYDNPTYIVGETAPYSRIGEIEDKIDALTYKGQTYTGGNESGVYLITSNDVTQASDRNAYSARRAKKEFLSKTSPDQTEHLLKLLGGAEIQKGLTLGKNKMSRLLSSSDSSATLTEEDVFTANRIIDELKERIVINNDNSTKLTDENYFSSLRSLAEIKKALDGISNLYLSKVKEDTAAEVITFKKGLTLGENLLLRLLVTSDTTAALTENDILSAVRTVSEIKHRAISRIVDDKAEGHIDFLSGLSIHNKRLSDIIRYYDQIKGVSTDTNVYSALMTDMRIEEALKDLDGRYLRKDKEDTAHKRITFEDGITVYKLAEMMNIDVKELATIAQAIVGVLRSARFVDGFAGEGYQIWKNIATGDWNMTLDRLTVRKVMTIYELIIQKIRAVGGMLLVSAADGKVKTVHKTGTNYAFTFEGANMFMPDDQARCQVFTGHDVKYYWVRVASSNAETVIVPESEFAGVIPAEGDEWVLMGNTTNKRRQSCILISATEDGQPRFDCYDGIKSKNLDGCLKVRAGNLDGISDIRFPANMQPNGNGLYAGNCFLYGIFMLTNGNDVMTQFAITEGMIKSEISSVRAEINQKDNYLSNASFSIDLQSWRGNNDVRVFTVDKKLLYFNNNLFANKQRISEIANKCNKKVLRIKGSSITQLNENFSMHPVFDQYQQFNADGTPMMEAGSPVMKKRPRMFFVSFKYMCARQGTMRVYFNGENAAGFETYDRLNRDAEVQATSDFQIMEIAGKWNGTGDFVIEFTGDIYLYSLALTDNRLADMEEKFATRFIQTDKKIQINADEIKASSDKLEEYHSSFIFTARNIRSEMSEGLANINTNLTNAYKSYVDLTARDLTAKFTADIANSENKITAAYNGSITISAQGLTTQFTSSIKDMEAGLTAAYTSAINVSAQGLTGDFNAKLTHLKTGITEEYNSAINLSAQGLTTSFNQKITDINGKLTTHESSFHVTAGAINAMVTRIDTTENGITGINQKISSAGWITTADGTKLWATITAVDALGNKLTTHESSFHVTAGAINAMVTRIDTTEKGITGINQKISSAGWITTADGTKLWATITAVDALGNKLTTHESSFHVTAIAINAMVSNIDENGKNYSLVSQTVSGIKSEVESARGAYTSLNLRIGGIDSLVGSTRDSAAAAAAAATAAATAALNAQTTANGADKKAGDNSTAIVQTNNAISAIAGRFDANGKLIEGSGWVTTSEATRIYATKTTVEGMETRLQKAEIKVEPESIRMVVREQTTDIVTSKVDAVQIGGVNLLINSSIEKKGGNEFLQYTDITSIIDKYGVGIYTISFDIKSDVAGSMIVYSMPDIESDFKYVFEESHINVKTYYQRFRVTVSVRLSNPQKTSSVLCFYGQYWSGRVPTVKNVKIEIGNKATTWSPATEDMASKSELLDTGIEITNKKIVLTADKTVFRNNAGQQIAMFDNNRLKADFIDVENLVATKMQTSASGARVEIKGSLMAFFGIFGKNIEVGVDASGYAVLTYYDNNGNKLYDLGPHGLDWGSIKPASWSRTRLEKVCDIKGTPTPNDGWVSDTPAYSDVEGVKRITANSGTYYYKYYAGSNPTITAADREPERYLYASQSLSSAKLPGGWYAFAQNDIMQYSANGTGEYIKPEADAIYQYRNGVVDRSPIFYARIMECRAGEIIRQKNVYWNG